jgi:hypothetical protein
MTTIAIVALVLIGAVAVWFCYAIAKSGDVLKDMDDNNAPYKIEPEKLAEQLAVSKQYDQCVLPKPKRKYTKRSGYWTTKRKKTAARKATKKTRKSK